jgi:hypothetical protein
MGLLCLIDKGTSNNPGYFVLDNYMVNRHAKSATPESMEALKYSQKHLNDEHKE